MGRSIKIVALFVFALLLSPSVVFPQNAPNVSGFQIHAHNKNLAQNTRDILESSYHRISKFIEDSLTEVVNVYVTDTEEEFRSLVGRGFPEWGVGCAIPRDNVIILKSPLQFKYYKPFSQVVTHELAHIFVGNLSRGGRVPRWLDEGFAMYHSQEWRIGQDIAVARAVLTGSFVPLAQIQSVNAFKQSKAHLAYTESFLAVSYLYGEFGEGTVKEIVGHLANGASIDMAFMKTIGSNYLAFQLEFEKYVQGKYNWASLLGDTFLLWVGLAILIVLVYLFKRRRAKSKLQQWELEEQEIDEQDELSTDQT
jgi:hypothetical protein